MKSLNKKIKNEIKQDIISENINNNFIKNILNELIEDDNDKEELNDIFSLKDKNTKKFKFSLYNNTSIFKYLDNIYLNYNNNSCWMDCFIMLYIFIYRKNLIELLAKDVIDNNNLLLLNEFINFIIQTVDTIKPLHIFDLYYNYINNNEDENFLLLDKNKLRILIQ